MATITNEQFEAFINALQLCLKHELNYRYAPQNNIQSCFIGFSSTTPDNGNLDKIQRLIPGHWETLGKYNHQCHIEHLQKINTGLLTSFLLLTRLQDDQIVALANQDHRYRPYAQALGLLAESKGGAPILSLGQARDLIFQTIAQKGLSLAAIAKHTGLSQVSLSNFKAGGDIKLSNLLKIAEATGLKFSLG